MAARLLLWLAMLAPGWAVIDGLVRGGRYLPEMLHLSGMWSVYLLTASLAVTPATILLARRGAGHPAARGAGRALLAARRQLGLGAAAYAALHVAYYALDAGSLAVVLAEATRTAFWPGWVAVGVMAALAATSTDAAARALGRWWKRLHRLTYAGAAGALAHWWVLDWPRSPLAEVATWTALILAALAVRPLLRRLPRRRRRPGNPPAARPRPSAPPHRARPRA
ncbi:ferric reductase-like transmembrane domain-containing protein [Jannaschia sp. Os4]|uniref:ferric reductase-like transmembrane domain-containing protein n=1 Tax=Jannaschia sp. Os4 TaxID=2807617 RepID=UPI0019394B76|nr:ferric reductase-like transmembrane domain-containing protein [Jannaschia sp. Os4]MBM2575747.1 ferric reductase-like transmembrane domain-containing protein [Jannaschia sp. Os4]